MEGGRGGGKGWKGGRGRGGGRGRVGGRGGGRGRVGVERREEMCVMCVREGREGGTLNEDVCCVYVCMCVKEKAEGVL